MENYNDISLEEAISINERETFIKLMPKWLAELDLIEFLVKKKKELEAKVQSAIKTIGNYECPIYTITVENKVETKIKTTKTIQKDIANTFAELKKVANDLNDKAILEKINALETNIKEDTKVTFAKPANKIKELNAICNALRAKKKDLDNFGLEEVIETKESIEYKLKQLQHLIFEENLSEEIFKANQQEFVC